MRILVTGSRQHMSKALIEQVIFAFPGGPHVIVHGGATGADLLVEAAAKVRGIPTEVHLADWVSLGPKAGPVRNQKMVDLGADICLAFPMFGQENKGTFDCINRCLKAGIKLETFPS